MTSLPSVARIGSQTPRVTSVPLFHTSAGEDAVQLADAAGLHLDEWQKHVLEISLGERGSRWAATEVGLVVPRQSGKGTILEARELAGLFLFGEKLIIHSAHLYSTSLEHYARITQLVRSAPFLAEHVLGYQGDPLGDMKGIKAGNTERGVELKNGNRLRILARSSGGGRGFSGDTIVLDEAYALTRGEMAALFPTMAAKSMVESPQIWYASSAGMLSSEVLEGVRERGVAGTDESLAYAEWSADPDADPDDRDAWYEANPALGIRISEDYLLSERGALGDEEFKRERLGIWATAGGESLFPQDLWTSQATDRPLERGLPVAFALDVPPSRDVATLCAAARLPDGRVRFEIVDRFDNFHVIADRLKALQEKWNPVAVVVDSMAAAGTMIDDLRRDGVRTRQLSGRQYTEACARFFDLVTERSVEHGDQPELNEAVDAAEMKRRSNSSVWVWARKDITHDISPLVGCTLALHGLSKAKTEKKKRQVTFL